MLEAYQKNEQRDLESRLYAGYERKRMAEEEVAAIKQKNLEKEAERKAKEAAHKKLVEAEESDTDSDED